MALEALQWSRQISFAALFICLAITVRSELHGDYFKSSPACPDGQFFCQDGDCIRASKRCDGITDCRDGDDEINCELVQCEAPEYFRCSNDKCIEHSFVCDGENDCGAFEDEKDCHLVTLSPVRENCTEDEFRCGDKTCIPDYMICDGSPDCSDGSDEILGCSARTSCLEDFMCKNKYCIPLSFQCDGEDDCNDGSDEEGCARASHVVPMSECLTSSRLFPCADRITCIELTDVCDNKADCPDGSDEGGQCSEKNQCNNHHCPSQCFSTPTGPVCTCARGSKFVNGTCFDIDECQHYGFCDQRCENLNGTYRCYCDPGYTLQNDRRTCKVDGGEAMMVFGAGSSIRTYYLTSHVLFRIAKDQGQVAGIGYDGSYVYWTNVMKDEESIMRCDEDGSNTEVLVTAGLGLPEDLAVDWITHSIYFTDSEMKHIGVCSNDGVSCTVLVNEDIDQPRSIVVHPALRYMYWTDWGTQPHVGRAGMDGSEPVSLVSTDIVWPNGLAIDYHNDRIYWVDAKRQKIESVKLDGSDRRIVLDQVLKHPFDIAVFEDTLYWSDWRGQQIQSCNKFTGKNHSTIIRERKNKVYGVHIFHSSTQHRNMSNPCDSAGCSHMCLLSPNSLGYCCACRQDSTLTPDKHTCRVSKKSELIFIAAGQTLIRVEPRTLGKLHYSYIPLSAIHVMGPITYDSVQGRVIIYDVAQKHIYSYDLESAHLEVLLAHAIGHITDMDYDYLAGNLYWTDAQRETVEVMSLNTRERAVILRELGGDTPMSVALVPEENAMFVAFYRDMEVHIDRFHMDGVGGRSHFVEVKLEGPKIAMVYDQELHRIFWSDSGTRLIESAAVDGADRHETRALQETVNDIASLGNDLFWVDRHSGNVYWINKYNSVARSKKMDVGLNQDIDSPHIVAIRGRRFPSDHPCLENNGNCSHICLASSKTAVCACPDGLILRHDFRTCVTPITCAPSQFKCKSDNACIPKHKKCNGKKDCPNGEDELNCDSSCTADQFTCKNGQCIDENNKCDNKSDCADSSDELNCDVHCNVLSQFTCKSGQCISALGRCNEESDCDDGSDEVGCDEDLCDPERNFRCHSGACIPRSWECDHDVDCPDGSDEHSKCPPKECNSKQFECKNKRCVDKSMRCDMTDDCGDNSDENECEYTFDKVVEAVLESKPIECFAGEFRCGSKPVCIPIAARCNGTAECLAGEDEFDCAGCHGHEFRCKNGNCIPIAWLCDQTDDCKDGSDENLEQCKSKSIERHVVSPTCITFRCPTGECLPWSKVCDITQDCPDGHDEGGICANACTSKNPCSQQCVRTPHGPKCVCNPGYQLTGDGRSCEDVDECLINDPCAQLCENTEGSYVCSCVLNFALKADMVSCKAIGAPMEYIFSSGNQIRRSSASLQNITVVTASVGMGISGLDVNSQTGTVFWSSEETGEIVSWPLANTTVSFIKGVGVPYKLAVDWITNNVYFADKANRGTIFVCNIAAQKCARVVDEEDGATVTSIAVDPLNGLLFWSKAYLDQLSPPVGVLMKSDLAGRNIKKLDGSQIGMVTGLAVDVLKKRLFFADQTTRMIQRVDYDGNERELIQTEDVVRPIDLVLFESELHWLSGESGKLVKCPIHKTTECESSVLASNAKNLRIFQPANQPTIDNPCLEHNCTYLCVMGPAKPVCLCKDGSVVNDTDECSFERSADVDPTFRSVSLTDSTKLQSGSSAGAVLGPLAAVAIFLIIVAVIFIYTRKRIKKMDCPVSLGLGAKSRESCNSSPEITGFHFENQSFGMDRCSPAARKPVQPGQHEYVNPQLKDVLDENEAYHDLSDPEMDKTKLLP